MAKRPSIHIKRIYDPPSDDDGFRVLVDRVWPRGMKKEAAQIELWAKELGPTTELRKWFNHVPSRFPEFEARYREELESQHELMASVLKQAGNRTMTLLYSARDREFNQAVVLQKVLGEFAAIENAPSKRRASARH
jgi:uncharacterized protein YeaO (DUF488 family)